MFKVIMCSIKKNKLLEGAVFLLFMVLFIDMGGEFGLRNVLASLSIATVVIINGITLPKRWLSIFALLIVYPFLLLLRGYFGGADIYISISQFQSTILAFALFIALYDVPYKFSSKAFVVAAGILALISAILAICLAVGIDSAAKVVAFMAERKAGYFGSREIASDDFMSNIYFKSTLFLVPAFVIALFKNSYALAFIIFLGLMSSLSKTAISVATLAVLVYLIGDIKLGKRLLILSLLTAALFLLSRSPLYILFEEVWRNDSQTVDVRVGHFNSLIDLWKVNTFNFLFGFGLGSVFYSTGAGAVVSNIEIDHLNTIRKYGFIWTLLFFSWVFIAVQRSFKSGGDNKVIGWSLLIAFIVAGTNPVLMSPLFFVVLSIAMSSSRK